MLMTNFWNQILVWDFFIMMTSNVTAFTLFYFFMAFCFSIKKTYFPQVVGCDGVVGSLSILDSCEVCQGDNNSTCRLMSGLFTKPHLPPGYSHITTIPQGACSLSISFIRPNNNHFGSYVFNYQAISFIFLKH